MQIKKKRKCYEKEFNYVVPTIRCHFCKTHSMKEKLYEPKSI